MWSSVNSIYVPLALFEWSNYRNFFSMCRYLAQACQLRCGKSLWSMLRHVYLRRGCSCTALQVLNKNMVWSLMSWDKWWDYFWNASMFQLMSYLKLRRHSSYYLKSGFIFIFIFFLTYYDQPFPLGWCPQLGYFCFQTLGGNCFFWWWSVAGGQLSTVNQCLHCKLAQDREF